MNRRSLPLVLMLLAGAVTCIITFIQGYSMTERLVILLAVLVLFYVLGCILVWTLNFFEHQNEEKRRSEGEVIEKEASAEGGEQSDESGESEPGKEET